MVINKSSLVPLADVSKLNDHIQRHNTEGWELFSAMQESVGIKEFFILFWRKTIPDPQTNTEQQGS